MRNKIILVLACAYALLSVILGSLATHGLRAHLSEYGLQVFHTGTQYQMTHALALLGVGIYAEIHAKKNMLITALCFIFGMTFFCGGLYCLALSNQAIFAYFAPVGGLSLMLGWVLFAIQILLRG